MLKLIPSVKKLELTGGFLEKKAVAIPHGTLDSRVLAALKKLPQEQTGTPLALRVLGEAGEKYELWIEEREIRVCADSPAGAFYAIQTLRQIFREDRVPCLHIQDGPDFPYRGFYHDVSRGRVPTVASVKKLIDRMAYFKLNSLQLYVEHTYEFDECRELNPRTGFLTGEELRQIGAYCRENFIEFIPSLSTFGHMYELLEQSRYRHLRVLKDYQAPPNFWDERMRHHTIDPLEPGSFELVKSLIGQYAPNFDSETFNICCDETFDLQSYEAGGHDVGKLYVDFVKQTVDHLSRKGKKVMMWADILLRYPQTIEDLPEDVCFLNWSYGPEPPEEDVIRFARLGRRQIVCPGTSSWNRLCEKVDQEERNICRMVEYGARHGAVGVLNTNWGDWGNPCGLRLSMYGLTLGAEKSWSAGSRVDDGFYSAVNALLYEDENGMQALKRLSRLHDRIDWQALCRNYFARRYETGQPQTQVVQGSLRELQREYEALRGALSRQRWGRDEFRQEMLVSAEGICLIAELSAKLAGEKTDRLTDARDWLGRYRAIWLEQNKPSELERIGQMLLWCEDN